MMSLNEKLEELVNDFEDFVNENAKVASAEQLGLDKRSFYGNAFVLPDAIVIKGSSAARTLNYYGGFEYVDASNVQKLGDFTIYSVEDEYDMECRVGECIKHFVEVTETETESN